MKDKKQQNKTTKMIIELRNFDSFGEKQDNSEAIEKITDVASKFWNCESVEVK